MSTEAISDLKYWCTGEPSECGKRVAKLLAEWMGGSHHLDEATMKKCDWKNQQYIIVKANSSITGGGLSTFDFASLTRLVFLAHDHCIRVDIRPLNPQLLQLMFHPRHTREGGMSERHPTIEQAVASWRQSHPLPDAQPPLFAVHDKGDGSRLVTMNPDVIEAGQRASEKEAK